MAEEAYHSTMTAQAAPFTRRDFTPFPPGPGEMVVAIARYGTSHTRIHLKSSVEQHPFDDINAVFSVAHAHSLKRRAILVPGA